MKRNAVTAIIFLLLLSSCSGGKGYNPLISSSGQEILPDCTGYTSEMVIPYGFTGPIASTMGGKVFAKLTAVDSNDGTMKITITPANGSSFPIEFLAEFSEYKIRFIACREDISSVSSGSSTSGVCSLSGSTNIVGSGVVSLSDFQNDGFTANGLKVHATRNPDYDTAMNYFLKPDFIMLTVSNTEEDPLGIYMIAYGRSPYYKGCYRK